MPPLSGSIEILIYTRGVSSTRFTMLRKDWVNSHKRRFYRATLFHDLLGNCILFRVWGCMDSHQSCSLQRVMDSWDQGLNLVRELDYRRERGGYRVVDVEKRDPAQRSFAPEQPIQLSLTGFT